MPTPTPITLPTNRTLAHPHARTHARTHAPTHQPTRPPPAHTLLHICTHPHAPTRTLTTYTGGWARSHARTRGRVRASVSWLRARELRAWLLTYERASAHQCGIQRSRLCVRARVRAFVRSCARARERRHAPTQARAGTRQQRRSVRFFGSFVRAEALRGASCAGRPSDRSTAHHPRRARARAYTHTCTHTCVRARASVVRALIRTTVHIVRRGARDAGRRHAPWPKVFAAGPGPPLAPPEPALRPPPAGARPPPSLFRRRASCAAATAAVKAVARVGRGYGPGVNLATAPQPVHHPPAAPPSPPPPALQSPPPRHTIRPAVAQARQTAHRAPAFLHELVRAKGAVRNCVCQT